jgi:hypothetical protein
MEANAVAEHRWDPTVGHAVEEHRWDRTVGHAVEDHPAIALREEEDRCPDLLTMAEVALRVMVVADGPAAVRRVIVPAKVEAGLAAEVETAVDIDKRQ